MWGVLCGIKLWLHPICVSRQSGSANSSSFSLTLLLLRKENPDALVRKDIYRTTTHKWHFMGQWGGKGRKRHPKYSCQLLQAWKESFSTIRVPGWFRSREAGGYHQSRDAVGGATSTETHLAADLAFICASSCVFNPDMWKWHKNFLLPMGVLRVIAAKPEKENILSQYGLYKQLRHWENCTVW